MICTCKKCGKKVNFKNWGNKDRVVSSPILFKYCNSCKAIKLEERGKRRCIKCKKVKSFKDDFYKNKKSLRGRHIECKPCYSQRYKNKYKKNVNSKPMKKNTKYHKYINPICENERKSIWRRKQSENVTDWHVKKVITVLLRKEKISLKQSEVPQALVDITRKSILLRREIQGGIRKTSNKW